jgi:hypothetical protein
MLHSSLNFRSGNSCQKKVCIGVIPKKSSRFSKVALMEDMESSLLKQHEEDLSKFKEWIKLYPEIPQKTSKNINCFPDEVVLLRYLKFSGFDVEKAGKILLSNLKVRNDNPHIFFGRSIDDVKIQKALSVL